MNKKLASFLLIIVGVMAMYLTAEAADPVLYLGVLEPWHAHDVEEVSTTPYVVRAAFQHRGSRWSAMPMVGALDRIGDHYPKSIEWTVAFDGKNLGHFGSYRPDQWEDYGDLGLFQPDPHTAIQLIRVGAEAFGYWEGTPPFRPLVVVSAPNITDPDGWKPWRPQRTEIVGIFPAFRVEVGTVAFKCDELGSVRYADDLIVLDKAYRANTGDSLIGLRVDPHAHQCDEIPDDNWANQWFLVRDGKPKFLGSSLELIDAGDYDKDGSSEVVFHRSDYNYDGYVLLYDRLRQRAEFGWIYH